MSKTINDKIGVIYLLTNEVNGKLYVGQTKNLRHRLAAHGRNYQSGTCGILYAAIRKYGIQSFMVSVLEDIHCEDPSVFTDEMNDREKY